MATVRKVTVGILFDFVGFSADKTAVMNKTIFAMVFQGLIKFLIGC